MAQKTIPELDQVTTLAEDALFVIDTGTVTRKIEASDVATELNGMVDRNPTVEVFTADDTFEVPDNVTEVILFGRGGSGGGGAATNDGGGGGGGGACSVMKRVAVTPSDSIAITIGTGGAGGDHTGAIVGDPGGDTTFGSLATFKGGLGGAQPVSGTSWNSAYLTYGSGVAGGGNGLPAGGLGGLAGIASSFAAGGAAGSGAGAGSGGGGGDGAGGAGQNANGVGGPFDGNNGTDGGGGGGGSKQNAGGIGRGDGGDGTDGKLVVMYFI